MSWLQSNSTIQRPYTASLAGRQITSLPDGNDTVKQGILTAYLPNTTRTNASLLNVSFSRSWGQVWQHVLTVTFQLRGSNRAIRRSRPAWATYDCLEVQVKRKSCITIVRVCMCLEWIFYAIQKMKINQNSLQMWRFMLVFPELGKQRQEDCQEFEASLVKI